MSARADVCERQSVDAPTSQEVEEVLSPRQRHEVWIEGNCRRWERAVAIEQTQGVAVCDTDPFKLHYTWCLWRLHISPPAPGSGLACTPSSSADPHRRLACPPPHGPDPRQCGGRGRWSHPHRVVVAVCHVGAPAQPPILASMR